MGLFDKLFAKKECSVCGGEIGLLGNRKLDDGNLCKNCAAKLSPWFTDRRRSTVEDIKEQLTYRENNAEQLRDFNITRSLGKYAVVHFDENKRKFIVAKTNDIFKENCDILDFSQVRSADLEIEEDRKEDKFEDSEGKKQSYKPPRYFYSYSFKMVVCVDHPFFDRLSFSIARDDVELNPNYAYPENRKPDPMANADYTFYYEMGNEIKSILLSRAEEIPTAEAAPAQAETAAEPTAPEVRSVCPGCGAKNESGGKFCEFCGTAL